MNELIDKELTAGGGIVFRYLESSGEPEVLLIFRNGVWDLPKGMIEEGESIEMGAAREVAEEVGSNIPAIVSSIGSTYHEYQQNDERIGKITHWYSMIFTDVEEFTPQREEGIEKVEWALLSEAIDKVGYETLKNILKKFKQ